MTVHRLPRGSSWPAYRKPGEHDVSVFERARADTEVAEDAAAVLEPPTAIGAPMRRSAHPGGRADKPAAAGVDIDSVHKRLTPASSARTQWQATSPWKQTIQASVDKAKRRKAAP